MAFSALAACSSTLAPHWTPFPPPRAEDWHPPYNFMLRYDSNTDGTITRRELEAGLRQDFRQADINHDGRLDPEEVREANLRRIQMDQSTAIPLIDWNGDGYVDFTEFSSGMRSVFEEYDANGDGVVTLGEMHVRIPRSATDAPAGSAPGGPH